MTGIFMLLLPTLSVRAKLCLLVMTPLLAAMLSVGVLVRDNIVDHRDMQTTLALVDLTARISSVADTLQRERGNTTGFLASTTASPPPLLEEARSKTDGQLQELRGYVAQAPLPETIAASLAVLLQDLSGIGNLRTTVNSRAAEAGKAFDDYTRRIGALFTFSEIISRNTQHVTVMRQQISLLALLCVKEQAARERGLLNGVFTSNKFSPQALARLNVAIGEQASCGQRFLDYADAQVAGDYEKHKADAAVAETLKLRALALAKAAEGDFAVDPKMWFATASRRVEGLNGVLDRQIAGIRSDATAKLAQTQRMLILVALLTIGFVVVTLLLALLIGRAVTRPLSHLGSAMGRLSSTLDLGIRAEINGRDEIADIGGAFNALVATLQGTFREVGQCAGAVASAAQVLAGTAVQVSAATQTQSVSVNSIAAVVEEFTVSIASVADSSTDARSRAEESSLLSEQGQQVGDHAAQEMQQIDRAVTDAAATIELLTQRSLTIGQIVNVIHEIAEQTNLLALNAAIEAARAGEQGRGFAVVADEVRKLAERTSGATRDISHLVSEIRDNTGAATRAMRESNGRIASGVTLVQQATDTLGKIHGSNAGTMAAVQEITEAMQEQRIASEDIAKRVERIAEATEENSRAVRQAADLAASLNELSGRLSEIVGRFQLAS